MNWVSPIKDDETLERFKQALRKVDDKYYILFEIGVGTGLQLQEILKFKNKDIRGKDEIEAARVHIPEAIRETDAHAAHSVPLRIPTGGFHRLRIGIGHENILFSGDLRRDNSDNAAAAAKIHNAHT